MSTQGSGGVVCGSKAFHWKLPTVSYLHVPLIPKEIFPISNPRINARLRPPFYYLCEEVLLKMIPNSNLHLFSVRLRNECSKPAEWDRFFEKLIPPRILFGAKQCAC